MRLCRVALSCSHCNTVNPTLQTRCIGYPRAVALSSPMLQITADVPVSDIIIGLTLLAINSLWVQFMAILFRIQTVGKLFTHTHTHTHVTRLYHQAA